MVQALPQADTRRGVGVVFHASSIQPITDSAKTFKHASAMASLSRLLASDCEENSAEGAALNEVTQSFSRFSQREGLSHDRFDRARLKQRDDSAPSISKSRLRLSEQVEAQDAGPSPDQVGDVDGCLAACRISQCCEASARRKRSERLAQDFTA